MQHSTATFDFLVGFKDTALKLAGCRSMNRMPKAIGTSGTSGVSCCQDLTLISSKLCQLFSKLIAWFRLFGWFACEPFDV